jgi:hypothetical protein
LPEHQFESFALGMNRMWIVQYGSRYHSLKTNVGTMNLLNTAKTTWQGIMKKKRFYHGLLRGL